MINPKDAQRYRELFHRLDANSDGKVNVEDLLKLFDKQRSQEENASLNEADSGDAGGGKPDNLTRAKVAYLFICMLF